MSSRIKNENSSFSGKVRVRVCGFLIKDKKILLLKHQSIGPAGYLWSPPGGGVEFGQSMRSTLEQEFFEETNLVIKVGDYLFINEFMDSKYHAIELFFAVKHISGNLKLGSDPELPANDQILTAAQFFTFEELNLIPKKAIHNVFYVREMRDKIMESLGLITL